MKPKILYGSLSSAFYAALLSLALPLSAEQQKGVEIRLSEVELQEIFSNPDRSYVYVGKEVSNIAGIMQELGALDENPNSFVRALAEHIAQGYVVGNYDAVAQALEEAEVVLQANAEALGEEKTEELARSLNIIIDQVIADQLNLDADILSFLKDSDIAKAAANKSCCGKNSLRLIVVKEKLHVLGKAKFKNDVTFYDDVKFKDDVEIQGTLSVADEIINCALTVGCNINMSNSASATVGNVLKAGLPFIHNTGTNNTFVGVDAGNFTVTGNSNVGIGSFALNDNIAGLSNTAVGNNALTFNLSDFNTAVGADALLNNTAGTVNTGVGYQALTATTTGTLNTAVGGNALMTNVIGSSNTAVGASALQLNTASDNTAVGYQALIANTAGTSNTAVGESTLVLSTVGSNNIALGANAGSLLTTGNNNIYISHTGAASESNTIRVGSSHAACFIAGVRGATTVNANAIPVLVDSAGQFGTVSSSIRFKHDVQNMGDASSALYDLRPVTFVYTEDATESTRYGLIAEEVDAVLPALVAYDEDGQPYTVHYEVLPAMILNELQKLAARVAVLEARQ